MTDITRLNSITYGGFKVGEGTSYDLHGIHTTEGEYGAYSVSAMVVVVGTSESNLLTLVAAIEAAYEVPNEDLTITLNGSNFFVGTHDGNSFMNARPSWRLLDSHRTNKTRCYRITVSGLQPADESGKGGRRESKVTIDTDDSGVMTLTVEATYTGTTDGNSATDNVTANFGTYVTALQTTAGGTWDATPSQTVDHDDENKVATVRTSYRQLIFAQAAGGTDHASLQGVQYTIRVLRENEPQLTGSGAVPLTSAEVTFSSFVPQAQTQDLDALVMNTVVPYLKTLVTGSSDVTGTPITATRDYSLDPVNNQISGRVTFILKSAQLVRASLEEIGSRFHGISLPKVFDGGDFSADRWEGPKDWTVRLVYEVIALGPKKPSQLAALEASVRSWEALGFIETRRPVESDKPYSTEVEGAGERIDWIQRRHEVVLVRADVKGRPSAGGGRGSGGGSYVPGKNIRNG